LATVYGIVKQSGGHIFVHSEEGLGSKFKIYLPCVNERSGVEAAVVSQPEPPGGTETILLVEDDDSVRNMILRILRDKGYEVVVARDGREALLILERADREFHLLLTDVVMPKMSGRQLSDVLRHRMPHIKILYVSGYAPDAMAHHGVLDHGVALLEKPFTRDELLRRVREALLHS
jgi:CheY-like chemotaxis protein